ncbi:hypothetical protein KFE25_002688 [Diacronema lutheri]|uniref:Uncharacterized protein n=1 Tax=Diacronema lutheri TaxID=2081491 RepID=A0A8J6CBS5_DIALT|nr:hypothetical protein KFE25_002688 [Diacronema lutheri]
MDNDDARGRGRRGHGLVVLLALATCCGLVVFYVRTAPAPAVPAAGDAGAEYGVRPPMLGSSATATSEQPAASAEARNGFAVAAPYVLAALAVFCILCIRLRFPDREFRPQSITLAKGPLRLRAVNVPGLCAHALDFYPPGSFPRRAQRFGRCAGCNEPAGHRPNGIYHCGTCGVLMCPSCVTSRTTRNAAPMRAAAHV